MIYIVTLLKTEIEEDKLKIIETKDIAYFTNLFNAQTSVVNNMGDIYDNTWKYVAIKGVTDNKLFANETILDAYFYECYEPDVDENGIILSPWKRWESSPVIN